MKDLTFSVGNSVEAADLDVIIAGLVRHNAEATGSDSYLELTIAAHNKDGKLEAGLNGWTLLDALTISYLWVAEKYRRDGVGARLIQLAEDRAIERGCRSSFVDTFSFQARRFYERQGYQVIAVVPNYPASHERLTLRKAL